MGFIREDTIRSSSTYGLIEPWGPIVIDFLGNIIPVFKNMFNDLEEFFGKAASNVA
jgi:membrane protein required for colicin V production